MSSSTVSFKVETNSFISSFVVLLPIETLIEEKVILLSKPITVKAAVLLFLLLEQAEPVEIANPFSFNTRARTSPGTGGNERESIWEL